MGRKSIGKHAHHLDVSRDAIRGAKIALLPGDPGRVGKISRYLQNSVQLASTREFTTHLGWVGKSPVLVASTGCGAPSSSICVEELAQLGVDTFIRVGTTGAIQPYPKVGDVAIVQGAVRWEGASRSFAPIEYPAVSSLEVTNALVAAAKDLKIRHHVGIAASTDTFYQGQERYDTFSGYVPAHLRGSLKELQAIQVLNYEMETALIYVMCSSMGLKAGSVCGIVAVRSKSESIASPEQFRVAESNTIQVAVEAAKRLI